MKLIDSRLPLVGRLTWLLYGYVFVLTVCAFMAIYGLIYFLEKGQFYSHLNTDFDSLISVYQHQPGSLKKEGEGYIYYRLTLAEMASQKQSLLPELFRGFEDGDHEIIGLDSSFHLFQRTDKTHRHLLVVDQSQFERIELLIVAVTALCCVLLLVAGYFVSRKFAYVVLSPLRLLVSEVEAWRTSGNLSKQHTHVYPNDELDTLAKAFRRYALYLNELLIKEQSFTGHVSHELRTPLMLIQSAVDLLSEEQNLSPMGQRQVDNIRLGVGQMEEQISEFLRAARTYQAGSFESRTANVTDVIFQQSQLWQSKAEAKGLTLHIVENERCEIDAPAVMLGVVVNNLLRNAISYTDSGNVTVTVNRRQFSVADTGNGMTDEQRCSVLAEMGEGENQRGHTSPGLGLSIIKRVCRDLGWQLHINENFPCGTVVTLRLNPI